MSTATANEAGGLSNSPSYHAASVGPLELKHMRHANYRAVADDSRITPTHRHIAIANGLGWGFDGMDGVIFALISPLIIREFALTVPQYRTGLQISLFIGIAGLYVWPWLSDRYGRRTLLAVNIALFSLLMPVVALSPTFTVFVIARSIIGFALNGEWSLGSMLVAETWPARLRGRVISINRAAWCFGASLAGAITGIAAAAWGWRIAVMVPGVIALLAIYVRATCPESPYWVRTQDRKTRVRGALERGEPVGEEDRAWYLKADKIGIRQVFMPDILPATLVALFVACCSTCIFGTVGAWMPLYLSTEKGWSTAEYSAFYVCWGIVGFFGLWLAGWLADRVGRRVAFIALLLEGAVFLTAWIFTEQPPAAVGLRPGVELRLPGLLGAQHRAHGGDLSHPRPRRRQRRGLGHRLLRGLRPVAVRDGRPAAGNRLLQARLPLHPGVHAADGARRLALRARACRQGAEQDQRLILLIAGSALSCSLDREPPARS